MNLVFDIGGLSTKYILFDQKKMIILQDKFIYGGLINHKTIEKIITQIYYKIIGDYHVKNIAISSLGVINTVTGEISGLGAIKDYHLVNWKTFFKNKNVNVYLENDANCAGLYEISVDSTLVNAMLFIVGTGLGGAIIINRELFKGSHFQAGEFGCGLEFIQNNEYYNTSTQSSTYSIVNRFTQKGGAAQTGQDIFSLYEIDDRAKNSIDEMIYYLAKTIVNNAFTLDPDTIIIGGAVSENKLFFRLLNQQVAVVMLKSGMKQHFIIRTCTKNNDANLYGALTLIK
ncbi:ROK family protein [Spiroplasma sp. SV19]|uniref:ROK family protein n=1 Tax=Spiroplasma sp. SV19 TaxID=2570468 RepID=UPI0024B82902|nr:ROK family protein [Spiroplasma sp. SV19]WHQ37246.1 ROK family protein [Spiroplasma sp. SV19]